MPGKIYDYNPTIPTTRVERLLRERELRRSNRSYNSNEDIRDANREVDIYGNRNNIYLPDADKRFGEEELLDGISEAKILPDGCEKQDGRPSKQRLLVVANRLPVAAVRKGEDIWQLEISAGGLVSALLGGY